jgi:hypothetical protein
MPATRALIRHFFGSFLGRGVLEDEGIESVRAVFFSLFAMLATVGLFLPRQFYAIYVGLGNSATTYQQALLADGFFMLSLPFLLSVFVAALVAPAMFPDEVDYITLVPLPLSRRRIFAAKLAALTIFGAVLLTGLTAFTSLAFPAFTHQPISDATLLTRTLAHAVASLVSGILGFGLVVALQGLTLILTPQRWVPRVSVLVQCVCVAGVILAGPVALRMTGQRRWISSQPDALFWMPPAWAIGVERWVSGLADAYWTQMAAVGVVALVAVATTSLLAYAMLYRHAERLILPSPPAARGETRTRPQRAGGVWQFTKTTLVRNRLPLLLFLVFSTAAFGFMATELADATQSILRAPFAAGGRFLAETALRFTLVLMLLGIVGLRMAFLVPVMSKANWIFRVTDGPDTRVANLAVADRAFLKWVIAPALMLGTPLQILSLHWSAMTSLLFSVVIGLLMVEVALAGWRRVPFTCTWIPGQRPLVWTLLASAAALFLVAGFLPAAVVAATRVTQLKIIFGVLLTVPMAVLRWRRMTTMTGQPLLFEDERYDKLQTLGLTR